MRARLTVYLGSTTINYQGSQQKQMGQAFTEAGYSLIGSPGTINSADIVGTFGLSCSNIAVDPGRIVVFEVACSAGLVDRHGRLDHGGLQLRPGRPPASPARPCRSSS